MGALSSARPLQGREVTVNIRAQRQVVDLIDEAARTLGKNRSSFMLETAAREAETVLLDKRFFHVSDEQFQQFMERLDSPPSSNPKLRKLLHTKAPWRSNAAPGDRDKAAGAAFA